MQTKFRDVSIWWTAEKDKEGGGIYKISATTQQIPLGIFITISFVPQDVALIR